MGRPNHSVLRKWHRWTDRIYREVVHIATYRKIFIDIKGIVRANARIDIENEFHVFLAQLYVTYVALAVRRQVDKDRRSISLRWLIEDIAANPDVLTTRRVMMALRRSGMSAQESINCLKSNGRMGAHHINVRKVRNDINLLECECEKVKRYVNKQVAHIDRRRLRSFPTYGDLNKANNTIEQVFRDYLILIRGNRPIRFEAVMPDWTRIFRVAWIVEQPKGEITKEA